MGLDREPPNPPAVRLVRERDADSGIRFHDETERAPKTPADVLRAEAGKPVRHVSTGIDALDAVTGGGPRVGDLVTLQGGPDAGKTLFAWALAEAFYACDLIVAFHAIDEVPERLATRAMQRRGANRSDVEARAPELAPLFDHLPAIMLFDASFTLEQVIAKLASAAGKRTAALFVDSVQKAPSERRAKASGMADEVSAVVALLNEAAQQRGWVVVVTSEATRTHYASSDPTQALGSARWSADLDFASKILISVAANKRDRSQVSVSLAKNKAGPQASFVVHVDHERQTITNIQPPRPEGKTAEQPARAEDESAEARERLFRIVVENPGIGARAFRRLSGLRIPTHDRVVTELELAGRIQNRPEVKEKCEWPHWFALQSTTSTEVGP